MTRSQALQNLLSDRFFSNPLDKVFYDLKINVGFEQSKADFLQSFRDILFGQNTRTAKLFENLFEFVAKLIQHPTPKKKATEALPPRSPIASKNLAKEHRAV